MNKKNLKKIFFPFRTGRNRFFYRNGTASSPLNPMYFTSVDVKSDEFRYLDPLRHFGSVPSGVPHWIRYGIFQNWVTIALTHTQVKMDHNTRNRNQETDFKDGLFNCCGNMKNCFAVLCCEPFMFGRIAQKVDFLGVRGFIWTIIMAILGLGLFLANSFKSFEFRAMTR